MKRMLSVSPPALSWFAVGRAWPRRSIRTRLSGLRKSNGVRGWLVFPGRAEWALLYGDPKSAAMFALRVKM